MSLQSNEEKYTISASRAQKGYREETDVGCMGVSNGIDTPGRKLQNKSGRQTGAQNRSQPSQSNGSVGGG